MSKNKFCTKSERVKKNLSTLVVIIKNAVKWGKFAPHFAVSNKVYCFLCCCYCLPWIAKVEKLSLIKVFIVLDRAVFVYRKLCHE